MTGVSGRQGCSTSLGISDSLPEAKQKALDGSLHAGSCPLPTKSASLENKVPTVLTLPQLWLPDSLLPARVDSTDWRLLSATGSPQ